MKKSGYFIIIVLALSLVQKTEAQIEKFQTTFIYTFTRSIQWPNLHNEPEFVIGVLSKSHLISRELKSNMKGRTAGGRPIKVLEFSSVENIVPCHILFVPNNNLALLPKAIDVLKNQSVLYVTENQGAQSLGSIINIYVEDDKMFFSLDEELTQKQNLQITKELKNYARN